MCHKLSAERHCYVNSQSFWQFMKKVISHKLGEAQNLCSCLYVANLLLEVVQLLKVWYCIKTDCWFHCALLFIEDVFPVSMEVLYEWQWTCWIQILVHVCKICTILKLGLVALYVISWSWAADGVLNSRPAMIRYSNIDRAQGTLQMVEFYWSNERPMSLWFTVI
jgi:hypothetical protein